MEENSLGLAAFKSKPKIDTAKYDGTRTTIAKVYKGEDFSDYNEEGILVPGLQRLVPVVFIETANIAAQGEEEITVKVRVNLKMNNGVLGYSLHPKATAAKILAKFQVENFEALIGKSCLVVEKTNPEHPDRKWLAIQY